MNKSIAGFLVALLFAPAIASSFVDCTENINGCPTTEARIVALQAQIVQLTQLLQQLLAQKSPSLSGNPTCFVPTYDLYIGRTDADMLRRPWGDDLRARFDERQWPALDAVKSYFPSGYAFVEDLYVLYALPAR
jgi:hypothetical protein